MVQDCKLDGDVATRTSLDAVSALLDLFPEIKRPFGVGAWCVKDCCNVVFEYNWSEEPNIDVACDLEDVLVLPVMLCQFDYCSDRYEWVLPFLAGLI
jgi:hypothetical protein